MIVQPLCQLGVIAGQHHIRSHRRHLRRVGNIEHRLAACRRAVEREPETARITAVTHDGRGIAAADGKKAFVAGALEGETVTFVRRKSHRNFDEAELLDASITGCDNTNVSWARVSKWLPWMRMGDRAGQMIYNGAGKRVASWDELPDVLKDELMRVKPEYKTPPPVDDDRRQERRYPVVGIEVLFSPFDGKVLENAGQMLREAVGDGAVAERIGDASEQVCRR